MCMWTQPVTEVSQRGAQGQTNSPQSPPRPGADRCARAPRHGAHTRLGQALWPESAHLSRRAARRGTSGSVGWSTRAAWEADHRDASVDECECRRVDARSAHAAVRLEQRDTHVDLRARVELRLHYRVEDAAD